MHHYFACVPVLLDFKNDVDARVCAVEDRLQFSELVFDMLSNCRRDFNMASGIFKPHSGFSLPRFVCGRTIQGLQTTARRSRAPGIFIWSRYLATVRRDNLIPS